MASTYTLSKMRSDLSIPVQESEAVTTEYLNRQINNAIQEICLDLEPVEMEVSDTSSITLASSNRTYSIASIDPFIVLSVKDTTANLLLRPFSREQAELYPEDETGEPRFYYRYGKNLNIYPLTDTAYVGDSLRILYIKKPTALSSDSDVSPLPEYLDRQIIDYACYLIFKDLNEPERATTWLASYNDAIKRRRDIQAREYERVHSSGRMYGR